MQIRPSTSLYTTLQALNEQNRAAQPRRAPRDADSVNADAKSQVEKSQAEKSQAERTARNQATQDQAKQAQIDQAFVQARDFLPTADQVGGAAPGKGGAFAVDPEFSREAPRAASQQNPSARPGQIIDIRV